MRKLLAFVFLTQLLLGQYFFNVTDGQFPIQVTIGGVDSNDGVLLIKDGTAADEFQLTDDGTNAKILADNPMMIGGQGVSNNENIILNFESVANTVTVTSGSGTVAWDWGPVVAMDFNSAVTMTSAAGGWSFDGAFDAIGAFTAGSIASDAGVSGTTITGTGKISTIVTTEQMRLGYDATNYLTVLLLDDGHTTFTTVDPDGAEADINFAPDGMVGIKTVAPTVELDVTGAIKASGTVSGATYGSDGSITDAELLTLDDGATTTILVGGGVGSAPVWTTATGTGAPVRAGAPSFTGDISVADDIFLTATGKLSLDGSTPTSYLEETADNIVNLFVGGTDMLEVKVGIVGIENSAPKAWDASWTALQLGGDLSLTALTTQSAGSEANIIHNAYYDGAWKYISTIADNEAIKIQFDDGKVVVAVAASGAADAAVTWAAALTIENDGTLIGDVGTTTTENLILQSDDATVGGGNVIVDLDFTADADATGGFFIQFQDADGVIGKIEADGAASVAYTVNSDYRLKENAVSISDGLARVNQLKPYSFNYIEQPERTIDGFFAHEVQEILPYAATGVKDAMMTIEYEVSPAEYEDVAIPAVMSEDGLTVIEKPRGERILVKEQVMAVRTIPNYQGMDYGKLTTILVAAVQELSAKVDALEAEVDALNAIHK